MLQKHLAPAFETLYTFVAVLKEAFEGFFDRFLLVEFGFGEEFVGKAYHLLFHADGAHIAVGDGEVLTFDFLQREAGTGVALAHKGVARITFGPQEVGTEIAVADVGMLAVAMDAVGIGEKDADVVQKGGFFDELGIEVQFGVAMGNVKGFVGYGTAMCHEDVLQFVFLGVILVDDGKSVHYELKLKVKD